MVRCALPTGAANDSAVKKCIEMKIGVKKMSRAVNRVTLLTDLRKNVPEKRIASYLDIFFRQKKAGILAGLSSPHRLGDSEVSSPSWVRGEGSLSLYPAPPEQSVNKVTFRAIR